MSLLIDSSVLIDVLRRIPEAVTFFSELKERAFGSVVTITELRAGQRGERDRRAIDELVSRTTWLPVGPDVAEIAGSLMNRYRKSHRLEAADALIAATAIHHDLQLATLNLKHFPMFPDLARPY